MGSETDLKEYLSGIRDKLRVTKVVATRSFKGRGGDSFAGFSAAWDSVQEDGGHGLIHVASEEGETEAAQGMTLREAKIAHYLLAMQADISAHEAAMAGGSLSVQGMQDSVKAIRGNYAKLIRDALSGKTENG